MLSEKDWNDAAQSWFDFVRNGKDFHRDGLNNPATFALIGNVKGQIVLDVACGEGYNTRMLARQGAEVLGIDFSERMIELAKKEEEKKKLGIRFGVMDAADLRELSDSHFDLVTCFMSLQDIKDYKKAISEVARVLRNRGRFVFSIPHPCFESMVVKGKRIRASRRYFEEAKYYLPWDMKRLTKPFRTITFHRTLADYVYALYRSMLLVSRLVEPKPTREALLKQPHLRRHVLVPQSIIVESVKCTD